MDTSQWKTDMIMSIVMIVKGVQWLNLKICVKNTNKIIKKFSKFDDVDDEMMIIKYWWYHLKLDRRLFFNISN